MKYNKKFEIIVILALFVILENCINDARRTRKKIRFRGPPGMPGRPGPKGKRGWIGSPGKSGNTGERGPRGETGKQGIKGIRGTKGFQGLMGGDGGTGPVGPPSSCPSHFRKINCAVGQPGYQGYAGMTGEKGQPGPVGYKGEMGPRGPTGKSGRRGRSGRPGSRGLLTEIKCRTGKTRFVRPMRFKNKKHSFSCNETNVEFLKGFEIETNGEKIRYRYKCCWFVNVFK